jgi:hypothetical protein
MPHVPGDLFARNVLLHIGVLTYCFCVHVWVWMATPENSSGAGDAPAAVLTLLLITGCGYLHARGLAAAYHKVYASGWSATVIISYMAGMIDRQALVAHRRFATSSWLHSLSLLLVYAGAGLLHASVQSSVNKTFLCSAVCFVASMTSVGHTGTFEMYAFVLSLQMVHAAGYLLSAKFFAQQVRLVRFGDNKERMELELALANKRERRSQRALEEVKKTLGAWETELTRPVPAWRRRVSECHEALTEPLFVLTDRAIRRTELERDATTSNEVEAARALPSHDDVCAVLEASPPPPASPIEALTQTRELMAAIESACTVVASSSNGSLASFKDQPGPNKRVEELERFPETNRSKKQNAHRCRQEVLAELHRRPTLGA